jgi:hypothetical protein
MFAEAGIDWAVVNGFLGAFTLVLLSIKSGLDYWLTHRQNAKISNIHDLVNSAMGEQLKLNASATARTAEVTGEAGDARVAEMAKSAVEKHEATQAIIDKENK